MAGTTEILQVKTKKQLREFVRLPKGLYKNDPFWVPPIWREEKTAYHPSRNPILANSDFALFVFRRGDRVVGRILAYIDRAFNDFYRTKTGFFGAFEAINEPEVMTGLLYTAESWVKDRGMLDIRGPINPVAEHWGFLQDGFDSSPIFLAPYNPPFYNTGIEARGYTKVKDLLAYVADVGNGYRIPERFEAFRTTFFKREQGYSLRRIDTGHLIRDAEIIWRLSNQALSDNWGYVPVDREVMLDMIKRLKLILNPNAVWIVEHQGRPVGYCLGFPDLNRILKRIKGRLFPFGFLAILLGLKKIRHYRLFGLAVLPEYQGKGLDVLLYLQLQTALKAKQVCMEANYILEDNLKIKNALLKLGMEHTKTYRVYEKKLL